MGFHQQIIINRIIPARPAMLLIIKQILNKLLQRHGIALWRTDKSVQERWGVVYTENGILALKKTYKNTISIKWKIKQEGK